MKSKQLTDISDGEDNRESFNALTKKKTAPKQELIRNIISVLDDLDEAALLHVFSITLGEAKRLGVQHPSQIPEQAPEYWQPRGGERKESICKFIARVYEPYLDGRFTQAHLRQLDPRAYRALRNWLQRNTLPLWLKLPTKTERLQYVHEHLTPTHEEAFRAYRAAKDRARRKRGSP